VSALPVEKGADGEPATELGSTYAGDPLLGLVRNFGLPDWGETALAGYVGVLAATILLVAANAGTIGVSRLVYGMAQYRQLPPRMAKVHQTYQTPYIAILVFSAIAALSILPGQAAFLGLLYSFGALLTFSVAHASLIGLRLKDDGATDAPLRVWGHIPLPRGRSLPLFAVLGLIGTGGAWFASALFNPDVAAAGFGWLAIGFVLYLLYRRRQGLPLLGSVKVVQEKVLAVRPATFANILVPVDTVRTADHATIVACQVAMDTGATVRLVHVLEVPLTLDIGTPIPEREDAAKDALLRLSEYANRYEGVDVEMTMLRGRRAGPALVEHIKTTRAQAVVVESPPFKLSRRLVGRTLEYLLRHAPCEVIIVREHESHPSLDEDGGGPPAGPPGGPEDAR
jgi:APA family basic amino acid/polyamine antiporter